MNCDNMEVTIEMACSVDGKIADNNGEEGFLLERGWEIMLELLQKYDVLVWGRKTFESVCTWGEEYVQDLKKIPMIILSQQKKDQVDWKNVRYCCSVEECLRICQEKGWQKVLVSGGAKTNNTFLQANVVNRLILNYNPVVFNQGIGLFDGKWLEQKLELEKIKQEQNGIVQVHYRIKKNK